MAGEDQCVSDHNILSAARNKHYDLGDIIRGEGITAAILPVSHDNDSGSRSKRISLRVNGISLSLVTIVANNGELLLPVSSSPK
jgi:hypothetical protein